MRVVNETVSPVQPFAAPLQHAVERPLAAPAVRLRAREAGVDLHHSRSSFALRCLKKLTSVQV